MPYLFDSRTTSSRRSKGRVVPPGFWKFGSTYMNFGPTRSAASSSSVRSPSSSLGTEMYSA